MPPIHVAGESCGVAAWRCGENVPRWMADGRGLVPSISTHLLVLSRMLCWEVLSVSCINSTGTIPQQRHHAVGCHVVGRRARGGPVGWTGCKTNASVMLGPDALIWGMRGGPRPCLTSR